MTGWVKPVPLEKHQFINSNSQIAIKGRIEQVHEQNIEMSSVIIEEKDIDDLEGDNGNNEKSVKKCTEFAPICAGNDDCVCRSCTTEVINFDFTDLRKKWSKLDDLPCFKKVLPEETEVPKGGTITPDTTTCENNKSKNNKMMFLEMHKAYANVTNGIYANSQDNSKLLITKDCEVENFNNERSKFQTWLSLHGKHRLSSNIWEGIKRKV